MKYRGRFCLCLVLLLAFTAGIYGQRVRAMDFRNRAVPDILMALADSAGVSILLDETVSGTATFHFSDSEFSDALEKFTTACHLHAIERDGVWYVSRIAISAAGEAVTVSAEDTELEHLVKALARTLSVTILYDPLPHAQITVFTENQPIREVLEVIVKRNPEYAVVQENGAWYLRRQTDNTSTSAASRISSSSIRKNGELYTMNIARGNFTAILSLLFRTAHVEYSMMQRTESTLENLYFENKTFEELLRLVCEQGNSDYTVQDGIYYVFEIQRRDVLKRLRDTQIIELRNLSVAELTALLPAEYAGASFIKPSPTTNSLYLTGSTEEIEPLAAFITMADEESQRFALKQYHVRYIKIEDFMKLLPKNLAGLGLQEVPGANAVLAQVNTTLDQQLTEFISLIDKPGGVIPIQLRYINSEELLKSLPPAAAKEEIVATGDPTLVFFTGTAEKKTLLDEQLRLLDQPKPQIRYQILVIQYQKSTNLTWDNSVSVNPLSNTEHITGNFSNIVNVNFDIISALGHSFAMQLNIQLGEDRARVLADTTLNGLSGQEIKFENTNTFRYLDVALDPETGKALYTGTTREINSGLSLMINGWVSGDGMITMKVDAAVSKQDESSSSSTNPPPTSERTVNTQVRTRSGTPVIIGGLMQIEKTENIRRLPILGYIPLLGLLFQTRVISDVTSEMVIYIIPHVYSGTMQNVDVDTKNEEYLRRYGNGAVL
jgi:type II secretory pathway component GspD/PulD (secretin)